ncbi:MAG: NAD(P)-dependent oxidoreductase, partial [candidate division WOR-3 bacterium]
DQETNIEKGLPKKVSNIFHIYEVYSGQFTKIFMANVTATLLLLEWAKKIDAKKFILLSSGEVYGYGDKINENAPFNPRSFYATTKFHAETLTRYYNRNFEIKILRLFFPYGKNLQQGYIYNLIESLKESGIIETDYGTITPTLIDDIIEPLIKFRDSSGTTIYNLCGSSVPLNQLIKDIEANTGRVVKKLNIGKSTLCGDCSRAKSELGYKETPLKDGILTLINTQK